MDKNIVSPVDLVVNNPNSKHYLRVDAYYGTTHTTAFLNLSANTIIKITNDNPDGFLGYGEELIGRTVTIRTSAMADIDVRGVDRVRLVYSIDDQFLNRFINEYDKPEDFDLTPNYKFIIRFI